MFNRKNSQTDRILAKRQRERELVVIAVMTAIAVVSRSLFYMLPQVKPMAAVIMITGAALGRRAGFVTGALSALLSNFIFGQGPWTIWQMVAFGVLGYCSGYLFYRVSLERKRRILLFAIYGGVSVFLLYGLIMDTGSAIMYTRQVSKEILLATYATGVPFNAVHGLSTFCFLLVMSSAIMKKLNRVKKKYGVFEEE